MDVGSDSKIYCTSFDLWVDSTGKKIMEWSIYHLEGDDQSSWSFGFSLSWKVGDGRQVHMEMDPWVGSGRAHILPVETIMPLVVRGVHFLS